MNKNITDKTKMSNWIEGDTFAVKIEGYSPEYDGRYLILIRKNYDNFDKSKSELYFRAKLTNKMLKPKTKEEIESLDYIKTEIYNYEEKRMYITNPQNDLISNLMPDELLRFYGYKILMVMKRGIPYDNFEYIGNFKIKDPENEFLTDSCRAFYLPGTFKNENNLEYDFIATLIQDFEKNNLLKDLDLEELELWHAHSNLNGIFQETIDIYFHEKNNLICKQKNTFITGWGVGLYDNDAALDIKGEYAKISSETQDENEILECLKTIFSSLLEDEYEKNIFWMVIADQQIKKNHLSYEIGNNALNAIENDLKLWNLNRPEKFKNREKEIVKLRKKIEQYKK